MKEKIKILDDGPVFPRTSEKINALRKTIKLNKGLLREIADRLKTHYLFEFSKMLEVNTEDGSPAHLLIFKTSLGEIAIMFPEDSEKSVAIYGKGELKHGPQSWGEFNFQIETLLESIHEKLIDLTKPRIK